MTKKDFMLSIGLPVYNGENYLAETIESILAQTYSEFELIISDNGSSDSTQDICENFAARDSRIQYIRNSTNRGASWNFNHTFHVSSGKFFKWAAHDDMLAPEYVEKCLPVIENSKEVAISHPRTKIIDEHGTYHNDYEDYLDLRSEVPHERFRDYLFRRAGMCNAIFGLIRSSVLKETSLLAPYMSSDRVLLGELILRGQVHRIPDNLFIRRRHPQISWLAAGSTRGTAAWFDPKNEKKIVLPEYWKLFIEYLRTIRRLDLDRENRSRCNSYMYKWLAKSIVWPLQRSWRQRRGTYPIGPDMAFLEDLID